MGTYVGSFCMVEGTGVFPMIWESIRRFCSLRSEGYVVVGQGSGCSREARCPRCHQSYHNWITYFFMFCRVRNSAVVGQDCAKALWHVRRAARGGACGTCSGVRKFQLSKPL